MIQHRKVTSSNIESWGFDPEDRVLEVRFKSPAGPGPLFRYLDVQDETIQGLAKARSVGTFFAKAIKPRYKAERVRETPAQRATAASVTTTDDPIRYEPT